jgi:hypothetical protein
MGHHFGVKGRTWFNAGRLQRTPVAMVDSPWLPVSLTAWRMASGGVVVLRFFSSVA